MFGLVSYSPQRGFQQLLPLSSSCYEGNDFAISFAVPETSSLSLIRIAIWGRVMKIVVLTGSFFLANVAGLLFSLNKSQIEWSPGLQACLLTHTDQFRWSIMINFVEDSILLAVMLYGVLRRRNATHLWELLCLHGLFWILAAVLTELPSVVLVFRNINDGWNMMFQYPHCMSKSLLPLD